MAVLATMLLSACAPGGGQAASSAAPVSASPSAIASPTGGLAALPTASGEGFCVDGGLVPPAVALVRAGTEPWPDVVRYLLALQRVIAKDAPSARDAPSAFKIRQLAAVVHTLALAVRGAASNYDQGDYAVTSLTRYLVPRTSAVSRADGC